MKQQQVEYWDSSIYWYFNKKWHRDKDLPARYSFKYGKLSSINYCQHGEDHRTTGPAYINYNSKVKEYFYQNREYDSLEEMQMLEACI